MQYSSYLNLSIQNPVFSLALVRDWEHRVVAWLVKMWCCMLGETVPLGLYCDALPQLSGLFRSTTGVGSVEIRPLVLSDLSPVIVDVSGQVLGGTDMQVVLNPLQKRLKGFVKDRLLVSCPHLLQVRIVLFWLPVCYTCVHANRGSRRLS